MKKLGFIVMPLMAISLLVSCNNGGGDTPEPEKPIPLEECTWEKISEVSEAGKASEWFKVGDTKKVQLEHQDLDKDGVIGDNEVYQTVRIIGFNHDVDPSGKTLGITFEFVDYISDKDGYSLVSLWQDTSSTISANFDYANSTIRKNLTNEGGGISGWYERESGEKSSTYKDKTVFSMLPVALQSTLKIARKKVNIKTSGSWVATDVNDKLFLLCINEMNIQSPYTEDVKVYDYYKNATPSASDPIRIKKQIKGADGALMYPASIIESESGVGFSYAGYNSNTEGEGGLSWLCSPNVKTNAGACACDKIGDVCDFLVTDFAFAVAPAFCI